MTDIPPVLETYSLEQSEASGDGEAEDAADGEGSRGRCGVGEYCGAWGL